MGVAGAREIFRRAAEFHQDAGFGDELARARAKDMNAKHAIGLGIGENLHKAIGVAHGASPAIGGEGKFPDLVFDSFGFQIIFRSPDGSDFGHCVDDARNDFVIHMAMLAGEDFGDGYALVFRLMREHGAAHDIANRINAGNIGREMIVNNDPPAIERDADRLQPQAFRHRAAADGHEHDIGFKRRSLAARGGFDRNLQARRLFFDLRDLLTEKEGEALLFEDALELLGDLAIHAGQDAIQEFDHRDLGAEPRPDGAKFKPDHTAADNEKPFRHGGKRQGAGRGDNGLFVNFDAGQLGDIGARRDDDILRLQNLRRTILYRDLDFPRRDDCPEADERIDLVLFEQERDAIHIGGNGLVLMLHEGGHIELRPGRYDAESREVMLGLLEFFRSIEQGLGRNAANIEAGAAIGLALFDNSDFQAELGGADGADIPARAGSDDNEIVGHAASRIFGSGKATGTPRGES